MRILSRIWMVMETTSCVKNRVRLRIIHQMVGPLPGPCVCGGVLVHRAALFFISNYSILLPISASVHYI